MKEIPDYLLTYLIKREEQRADAVTAFLGSLTNRERGLVHDMAVMGYVQGLMRDPGERMRKGDDPKVVSLVIDACLALPDLYPTVAAIDRGQPLGDAP
jgi:hypothetical protein